MMHRTKAEHKVSFCYKLQQEIERYSEFQSKILGIEAAEIRKKRDIDIKNYAKYILREETIVEKRDVLVSLKNKLILKDGTISL